MATNPKVKKILLIIAFVCFSICAVFAQGPGFEEDVEDTPLDGGVTLIAAATIGYGIKKISDNKKQK